MNSKSYRYVKYLQWLANKVKIQLTVDTNKQRFFHVNIINFLMQEDIVSIYSMSDDTIIKLISQLVPHLWSTSLWPSSPDGQLFSLIHQSFHQQSFPRMLSFLVIPFWLPRISRLFASNSGTSFECHTHYIFRFFI